MQQPNPATNLHHLAPEFAGRIAGIITALIAVIARGFLRNPRLVVLTVPLYRRLTRITLRVNALMAGFAEHRLPPSPRHHKPGKSGPKSPIPTIKGFLVRELKHEASAYRSQFQYLLAQPGIADLLNAVPEAKRLLNPLCHLLNMPRLAPPIPRRRAPAQPPPPPAAQTSAPTPGAPSPTPPPPAPARPVPRPAPCEHLARRWPWLPKPA